MSEASPSVTGEEVPAEIREHPLGDPLEELLKELDRGCTAFLLAGLVAAVGLPFAVTGWIPAVGPVGAPFGAAGLLLVLVGLTTWWWASAAHHLAARAPTSEARQAALWLRNLALLAPVLPVLYTGVLASFFLLLSRLAASAGCLPSSRKLRTSAGVWLVLGLALPLLLVAAWSASNALRHLREERRDAWLEGRRRLRQARRADASITG